MSNYNKPVVRTQALFVDEVEVTATSLELNKAADISSNTAEYTASGAIPTTVQNIELNHATVAVETTIADFSAHQGMVTIKDTSATGTAAHTVTLTAGTFNGTNNIATFNALNEFVAIWVDSAGNGTVLENVGTVAFSTAS